MQQIKQAKRAFSAPFKPEAVNQIWRDDIRVRGRGCYLALALYSQRITSMAVSLSPDT